METRLLKIIFIDQAQKETFNIFHSDVIQRTYLQFVYVYTELYIYLLNYLSKDVFMTRTFLSMVLGMILFAITIQAHNDISRFQKHHNSKFNKKNLKGTQEMLIKSLESSNPQMIASAAQTVRELQQIFPNENFDIMLDPLTKIVKDENGETSSRILSLFALESFHSDIGDV